MSNLKMGSVKVLIHGTNRHLVNLQKTALNAFDFRRIEWSNATQQLRDRVTMEFQDIIIINDDPSFDLELLLKLIRADEKASNPFAIVIVVSPSPSRKYIASALKVGADGVIGLPFSANSLWKQLAFFVNNQRTFVRIKDYFGPDRRRFAQSAFSGDERRAGEIFDEDYKTEDRKRLGAG